MSLSVRPISAILDKDTDSIGDSDPYVILLLGQEKHKGKPCKGCGVKPNWNETFNFTSFTKDNTISIQVWDKDTFSADDLMGTAEYDIKKVLAAPNTPFSEYVKLSVNGKPSGQVLVEFKYTGPAIGQPGQQGGQGGWGQQGRQQGGQQGGQGGWGQPGQQQQGGWGQPQGQQGGQGGWGQPQQGGQQGGWNQQGQQGGWGQQGQQQQQQGGWGQPLNNQGKPPQQGGQDNQGGQGFIM